MQPYRMRKVPARTPNADTRFSFDVLSRLQASYRTSVVVYVVSKSNFLHLALPGGRSGMVPHLELRSLDEPSLSSKGEQLLPRSKCSEQVSTSDLIQRVQVLSVIKGI